MDSKVIQAGKFDNSSTNAEREEHLVSVYFLVNVTWVPVTNSALSVLFSRRKSRKKTLKATTPRMSLTKSWLAQKQSLSFSRASTKTADEATKTYGEPVATQDLCRNAYSKNRSCRRYTAKSPSSIKRKKRLSTIPFPAEDEELPQAMSPMMMVLAKSSCEYAAFDTLVLY